jgi:septum site-determining protein MinC
MRAAGQRKTRPPSAAGVKAGRLRKANRPKTAGTSPPLAALSKRELVSLVETLRRQSSDVLEAAVPKPADPPEDAQTQRTPNSLVIDGSVRSGQVVEFLDGDVTVIGSVGSAAEIVAGGSIHVYGTLRGRAIAGMNGDRGARIICRNMQAELLCIDGHYRSADNFEAGTLGRPIHARLDGLRMLLTPLE